MDGGWESSDGSACGGRMSRTLWLDPTQEGPATGPFGNDPAAAFGACIRETDWHRRTRGKRGCMSHHHACDGFQEVPRHFRRDAPMDPHQRRRHEAVLALLRELPPGRVLDYGFGWGDIAYQASKTHPDIHAVDVESRRVEFARHEYAPIPFDQCRPDGLDFPDASFDIVLSIVVLPFVPDDDAYMAEVRRVLRPGGKLIVATKTWPFLPRLWRRLSGSDSLRRNPASRLRLHDAADAAALLDRHGFTIVRRSMFYDPPLQARRNLAELLNGLCELGGNALGLVDVAPYPLFLAQRRD